MVGRVPYEDRIGDIRRVLIEQARARTKITYGKLGLALGIPARGPWKAVLDELSHAEKAAGRPDITYLVVKASTGYPGQIGFKLADPLSDEQRILADATINEVREYYRNR
jgi:hypothetical protein